ncbi:TPR repeat-containing protein [Candidatus Magnetomorum sp. HK-1]|nr:TPR repeat-containing protein [Candidatus Magnetomorum sp. HK-1]
MLRLIKIYIFFVVINLIIPNSNSFCSSKAMYGDWWIKTYGQITSGKMVSRVITIFEKLSDVANKPGNIYPNLIIIKKNIDPCAFSLQDGSIILTKKAIDICYRRGIKVGDSRIAFVLGHELAHLSLNHFWHFAAFQTISKHRSKDKAYNEIIKMLKQSGSIEARKISELQADEFGLIYTLMAGYDPKVIINNKGKNFFQYWSNQLPEKVALTDKFHPTSEHRANYLLSKMKAVIEKIELFSFATLLYHAGKYNISLDLLNSFYKSFPSREVNNNIGLIYFQQAISALSKYNSHNTYRFMLSTTFDPKTKAENLRNNPRSDFLFNIKNSIKHFRDACKKDRFYIRSRVNLSSALILNEKYVTALSIFRDQDLMKSSKDPYTLNNRAIVLYLFDSDLYFEKASKILKDLIKDHPLFPNAYYNLARLYYETNQKNKAYQLLRVFIKIMPSGEHANIARQLTGDHKVKYSSKMKNIINSFDIVPGDCDNHIMRKLNDFSTIYKYEDGLEREVQIFSNPGMSVLVVDKVIEIVQKKIIQQIDESKINSTYGQPTNISFPSSGQKSYIYNKFGLTVKNNKLSTLFLF